MVASTRRSCVPCGAVPSNRGTLVFHWCCPDGYNGTRQNPDGLINYFISNKYRWIEFGRPPIGVFHRFSSLTRKALRVFRVGASRRRSDRANEPKERVRAAEGRAGRRRSIDGASSRRAGNPRMDCPACKRSRDCGARQVVDTSAFALVKRLEGVRPVTASGSATAAENRGSIAFYVSPNHSILQLIEKLDV